MRRPEERESVFTVPVDKIEIGLNSRDDIPAILVGLQRLYLNTEIREQILKLMEEHVAVDCDHGTGRPGMNWWRLLVLATMKQGLDCDYARLGELANHHDTLREMLQHEPHDKYEYTERTLENNIDLLPVAVLNQISDLEVQEGLAIANKDPGDGYVARVDSFVVETNVHHPTDVKLLWDATRLMLSKGGKLANRHHLQGWRQWQHHLKQGKNLYNRISRAHQWRSRPHDIKQYLAWSMRLSERMSKTLPPLQEAGARPSGVEKIQGLVETAMILQDQVRRRLLEHETIPQNEKIFSVFEPHTRWINKGKAKGAELGVPLSVVEESTGFILAWRLHWKGGDTDAAVPLVKDAQARFPALRQCSFDRGYHSPENQKKLDELLERVVLPVKGRGSKESRAYEATEAFVEARRQHPAVESAIHALECHGLSRIRNRGAERFERTVALSILAANCHRLGRLLQEADRALQARRKRYKQAA